jgi:hypothetical protein
MKQTIITACVFFICIAFSIGTSLAGGASADSCESLGFIQCDCIECQSGSKFGMVGLEPEYDPEYGDCTKRYREARQRCANAYGKPLSEVGAKWSYKIGLTTYWGWYPSYCSGTPKTRAMGTKTGSSSCPDDKPYKTSQTNQ